MSESVREHWPENGCSAELNGIRPSLMKLMQTKDYAISAAHKPLVMLIQHWLACRRSQKSLACRTFRKSIGSGLHCITIQ